MTILFTQTFDLTTTASRVAEAADTDRFVHVIERQGESYIGFGDFDGTNLSRVGVGSVTEKFTLPAGTELWAASFASSGTSSIELLVTSIGR